MIVRLQGENEKRSHIYYEYDNDSIPLHQSDTAVIYSGYCFKEGDKETYIPVAIKRLEYISQDSVDGAVNEASVQLIHDNLLRMYGFVSNIECYPNSNAEVYRFYVIMELLHGVSLLDVLDARFTDSFGIECSYAKQLYELFLKNRNEFVRTVMSSVLQGVKALHDAGYIHRCLNLSNVMITQEGRVKVIGFWNSKKLDKIRRDDPPTRYCNITPNDYAAPEYGVLHLETFATDIYSLGMIAFHLYTGRFPFTGTYLKFFNSRLPLREIKESPLRDVIMKATEKDPKNRYQYIDELLHDIEKKSDITSEGWWASLRHSWK